MFGAYFEGQPPFSRGKKAEFPDALALHALDREAAIRQTGFLVVSEDGDWRAFCENSQRLYLVPKVEKALSLINNAPLGLRRAVVAWFGDDQGGRDEVGSAISSLIEILDVDAVAYANSGDVETDAWAPEVRLIVWPDEEDIDIIETEELGEGHFSAVVSLPVLVTVKLLVELSFSVWDSVDKEPVGMGGRSIDLNRDEEVRVTATIDFHSMGDADEEIELVETELDLNSLDVDLGAVDIFEPDDFDYS